MVNMYTIYGVSVPFDVQSQIMAKTKPYSMLCCCCCCWWWCGGDGSTDDDDDDDDDENER